VSRLTLRDRPVSNAQMKRRRAQSATAILLLVLVCLIALNVTSCKKEEPPPAVPTPSATATPPPGAAAPALKDGAVAAADASAADAHVVKAGTAPVNGTVKLAGKPPEMQPTKRQADPFCAKTPMKDEEVMVGPNGGLKNVIIRVTQGLSGNYEPPMTNATLDQQACMYRPRVQAIMAGQSLLIRNSDQTLHNVHTYKGPSTLFNQAEIPGLPPIAKKFAETNDILKFKCDVHPWMTGYVAISNNPFFAISGDDGTFTIPKMPAGKYTLTAWHERYGTKTTELTVEAGTPAMVTFQYDAK
jgi:plastocyanin